MSSLRNQVLLILAVSLGSLLTAKTLVDLSRSRPRVEDEARAQGRVTLLQAASLLERAYADGQPDEVPRILRQLVAIPGMRQVALVRPDGTVLAASDAALEGRRAAETVLAPMLERTGSMDPAGGLEVVDQTMFSAIPVRLAAAPHDPQVAGPPIPAAGTVSLAMETDLAGRFAAARLETWVENGIGFLVSLLVLALVGLLLEVRLGRPARHTVQTIEQFEMGDRGARTGIRGLSEIASVARAFDMMAERVQAEHNQALDTQTALDNIFKALPVGLMVVKRDDGRPYYVNLRWRELFGIHMEVERDILAILSTVRCERPDGSPYPIEQLPISTVLRTGEPAEARDLCVRHDDRVVALIATALPVNLAPGESYDAVVVVARKAESADARVTPPGPAAHLEGARPQPASPSVPTLEAPNPPGAPHPEDLSTVLLADADAETRMQGARALGEAGFRVLVAEDGARALSLLRNEGPRVEIIVLDLALEGPGGGTVLDELLLFDPAARVIAASHYRPDLPALAASGKVTAFLTRPYGTDRLVRAVREVIASAGILERALTP